MRSQRLQASGVQAFRRFSSGCRSIRTPLAAPHGAAGGPAVQITPRPAAHWMKNPMREADLVRGTQSFADEVSSRFGILPNFFCSAPAAEGLLQDLWKFAKSGYLDC